MQDDTKTNIILFALGCLIIIAVFWLFIMANKLETDQKGINRQEQSENRSNSKIEALDSIPNEVVQYSREEFANATWSAVGEAQYLLNGEATRISSPATKTGKQITGTLSWYRYKIGNWTNENALTCASRDFSRYSWVRISVNGMSVECKITDYGPDENMFPNRIIDASPRVFRLFAPLEKGLIHNVIVEEL